MIMHDPPAVFHLSKYQRKLAVRIVLFTRERPTSENDRGVF
jgi:hypothetical protein